jgi:putative ABC transport system ATP-binding protein
MSPAPARGVSLRLRALTITFPASERGQVPVLDNIDWELPAGTSAALCGPSGSGKTTLLNAIAGIEATPKGTVQWGDTDVSSLGPLARDAWRRQNIGFLFQNFHLFPGLDACGNVLLPFTFRALRPRGEEIQRAVDLLERVGVRPGADTRTLSRGEQQRVALARAVCGLPRIVLADEPTASLDAKAAKGVLALLETLSRDSGATLIVATHDRALAQSLGNVNDLREGRLVRNEATD